MLVGEVESFGEYLFVSLSLSADACIFIGIAPSFGQKMVSPDGVIAQDHTGRGKVKDRNAGADCYMGAVELGY